MNTAPRIQIAKDLPTAPMTVASLSLIFMALLVVKSVFQKREQGVIT